MAHLMLEVKVVKTFQNLLEKVPCGALAKPTSSHANIEEIPVLSEIHDHIVKLTDFSIDVLKSVNTGLNGPHQIWVV